MGENLKNAIIVTYLSDIYNNLSSVFNNRELAIGFWIFIFIIFIILKKGWKYFFSSLLDIIKSLFHRKLLIWHVSMALYFGSMILILTKIDFWEWGLLKETLIWFLAVGIISSAQAVDKAKDTKYFSNLIKYNIKAVISLQLVVNLYSFSLFWEVIQVFIITVFCTILVFMEKQPEYQDEKGKKIQKMLTKVLAIIGFSALFHSIRWTIINLDNIILSDLLKSIVLPTILSLLFIGYIYLLVVYAAYEKLFLKISFQKTIEDKYRLYLKIKTLLFCNININRISNFIPRSKLMKIYVRNKEDVKELFVNYRRGNKIEKGGSYE